MSRASSRPGGLGRQFWTLVTASGLSNLADGIFKMALPLVAVHYTRSPALIAGLQLVRTLPWLLGALQVGALTDRLDRRRSMLWANTARTSFVAVPLIAIAAGEGGIWLLYIAALGTGVTEVFYDTAAQSILPAVVPRDHLDRANGRLYSVELGSQEFAGPPIAGALVALGLAWSFAASAGLWVAALVALLLLKGTFLPSRHGPSTTIRSDIGEGLRFVNERPVLRSMAIMVGVSNLANSAVFAVFALFAVGPGSAMGLTEPQFGFLFALLAVGGVLGGVVSDRVQGRLGRSRALTLSVLGMILYVATPAFTANVAVIATVMFIGGFTIMQWNVISVSFRQRVTPDELLGRVNSSYRLVAWGTLPLGAALGGAIGEWLGLRSVFAIMGLMVASILIPNRRLTDAALSDPDE